MKIKDLTRISILSAMAVVLMLFDFPLFFAPGFYKLDFSDFPALIGGFAMGPLYGAVIELIKVLGNLLINGTDTFAIGELANLLMGISLVVPASILYKKMKSKKGAVLGMVIGTLSMVIMSSFINAFILLPTYSWVMKMPIKAFVSMGSKVNPLVSNLPTLIIFAVAPFNLFKGLVVSFLVFITYKRLSPLLHDKSESKKDQDLFKDSEEKKEV